MKICTVLNSLRPSIDASKYSRQFYSIGPWLATLPGLCGERQTTTIEKKPFTCTTTTTNATQKKVLLESRKSRKANL